MASSSELSALGIGKETTPGTAVVPTLWLPARNVALDLDYTNHERSAPKQRVGRTVAADGTALGKGGFDLECEPPALAAILNLIMGAESIGANAANPTVPTGAPTLSGPTVVGATVLPFSSATGYIAGNGFRVDAGLATQEDFVIASVATNNVTVTAPAKYAHATAAAIAPCALAYDHTFTLASPRNYFSAQWNRINGLAGGGTKVAAGCKLDSVSFTPNAKDVLLAKVALEYLTEANVSAPAAPSFSTLTPILFEQSSNYAKIAGVNSDALVTQFGITVNAGLIKDFFGIGNRTRTAIPEGSSMVNGTIDLAFESANMQQRFWGAPGATGPQSIVTPVVLNMLLASNDNVNASVPYQVQFIIGKAKLTGLTVKASGKSYITQAAKFEAYETANALQDDLKVVLSNNVNTASIS